MGEKSLGLAGGRSGWDRWQWSVCRMEFRNTPTGLSAASTTYSYIQHTATFLSLTFHVAGPSVRRIFEFASSHKELIPFPHAYSFVEWVPEWHVARSHLSSLDLFEKKLFVAPSEDFPNKTSKAKERAKHASFVIHSHTHCPPIFHHLSLKVGSSVGIYFVVIVHFSLH